MLPNLAYAPRRSSSTGRSEAFTVTTVELQLISALRAGDDSAFMQLVDAYHAKMVRLRFCTARGKSCIGCINYVEQARRTIDVTGRLTEDSLSTAD